MVFILNNEVKKGDLVIVTEKHTKLQELLVQEIHQVEQRLEEKVDAMKQYRSILLTEYDELQETLAGEIKALERESELKKSEANVYRNQLMMEKAGFEEFIQERLKNENVPLNEAEKKRSIICRLAEKELRALDDRLEADLASIEEKRQALIEEKDALEEPVTFELQQLDGEVKEQLIELVHETDDLVALKSDLDQMIEERFIFSHKEGESSVAEAGKAMERLGFFQKRKNEIMRSIHKVQVSRLIDQSHLLPKRSELAPLPEDTIEEEDALWSLEGSDGKDKHLFQQLDEMYYEVEDLFQKAGRKYLAPPKLVTEAVYQRYLNNIEYSELQWVILSAEGSMDADKEDWDKLRKKMKSLPEFLAALENRVHAMPFFKNKVRLSRNDWNKLNAYYSLSNYLDFFVSVL